MAYPHNPVQKLSHRQRWPPGPAGLYVSDLRKPKVSATPDGSTRSRCNERRNDSELGSISIYNSETAKSVPVRMKTCIVIHDAQQRLRVAVLTPFAFVEGKAASSSKLAGLEN